MNSTTWIFPTDRLKSLPSLKNGMTVKEELAQRSNSAYMINYAGARLKLTQLVSNTAIVFMHRFYMFQRMDQFLPKEMGPAFMFLASKIEEHIRSPKHILLAFNLIGISEENQSPELKAMEKKLFENEKILVQTLGFDFMVYHPHVFILKAIDSLNLSKEIVQTAYFFATCSLHLSYFCVQFKSSYIAALCIQLACSWAKFKLIDNDDGPWWFFIDKEINFLYFNTFYTYFSKIIDQCPSRIKSILIKFNIYNQDGSILEYSSPIKKSENQNLSKITQHSLSHPSGISEKNRIKASSTLQQQSDLNIPISTSLARKFIPDRPVVAKKKPHFTPKRIDIPKTRNNLDFF